MSIDETPSRGAEDEAIQMENINSPLKPRRLRRAGQDDDGDEDDDDDDNSPERPRNAFDALREGQMKRLQGGELKKKDKAKKSDFIAEEVEESEDEGEYSMLRKMHEEGDEEDGSDLDATVEELVDDEKADPDEEEAQDELADEHHRDWAEKQDAKATKMVEKVVAGKMKRRRGDGGELDDSDYEDDDMVHRKAKARKPKQFSSKMEALSKARAAISLAENDADKLYRQLQIQKHSPLPEPTWTTVPQRSMVTSFKRPTRRLRRLQMRKGCTTRTLTICHIKGRADTPERHR